MYFSGINCFGRKSPWFPGCIAVFFLPFISLFFVSVLFMSQEASAEPQKPFDEWLVELKAEALDSGISPEVTEQALGQAQFIERVIKSDRSQAEFKETYQQYINKRVSEYRIRKGGEYLQEHARPMAEVTNRYGVPAHVVAAILGIETNYGTFKLSHSLFDVLVTLSYDTRRGARFRKEIFAALRMLDSGEASFEQLKSSWAGALGVPQFMPSTYLQFAQDADGDGRKNIWEHGPDLWASVAKYLSHYGWDDRYTWARKVQVPLEKQDELTALNENLVSIPSSCARYKKHLEGWRVLDDWNELGVRRMNSTQLPKVALPATIIMTDPELSHAYLVYENFCVLMRYNPSFKYALAVGALSDAIKIDNL